MNPVIGILLIALGSIGAASFYVPFKKVKNWAWESYWIVQGLVAWILAPWVAAFLTVPGGELGPILAASPSSAKLWATFFGILWNCQARYWRTGVMKKRLWSCLHVIMKPVRSFPMNWSKRSKNRLLFTKAWPPCAS